MKALILGICLLVSSNAEAVLTDIPGGYFQDQNTGYRWRDVSSFFGMNYNQMLDNISGTGFTLSNETDLKQMHSSTFDMDFNSIFSIIGGSTNTVGGLNEYILGAYSVSDAAFGASSIDSWNGVISNPEWSYAKHNFEHFDRDAPRDAFGLWAVDKSPEFATTHTPEPTSLLLLGGGLLGLLRRRSSARNSG